ncbi:M1 family metallopeptidase [Paremcibacter congregatus]|uniref:M1 family metallopeptidase n=1 Tax=Paremcibacter congregatus TaxID=2043170 RepID=UPI003A92295F
MARKTGLWGYVVAGILGVVSIGITAATARDPHSFANVEQVASTHLNLDIIVDFDRKVFEGTAEYDIKRLTPGAHPFVLDTRDLVIHKVEVKALDQDWELASFELAKALPPLGSKLTVTLPVTAKKVRIHYATRPEATGLQWLTPAQTAGKKHPYVFTESQPIHTRSWVPIQDTPALRLTYHARIRTPEDLKAVMSALNDPDAPRDGDYEFDMPHKIPPYLMALGVGDLYFKSMSENTGVYGEAYILDGAAAEFADTYKMMQVAEKMYGPYQWGRYDILMMPPSYPMGGMENPMLSFITPTVIAGDKSLVGLIAHELAHSWSGNLVTNANWNDLWLNEGTTSYVENRIMEEVYGPKRALMEQVLAVQGLHRGLKRLDPADTSLHANLDGRDPDDAFSEIPYDKGQLFLRYLEEKFGRARFDPFLKGYFTAHAFENISSEKFIDYLQANLLKKYPGVVSMAKVREWIYGPGLPEDAPNPTSNVFEVVAQQQGDWLGGKMQLSQIPTGEWTVHEWLYFITNLPKDLKVQRMAELDRAFDLTRSTNNEIAHAWLLQGLKHDYKAVTSRLREYLPVIGRKKLILPLYEQLATTPDGLKLAREIYAAAREGYHPSAQKALDKVLAQ